MALFFLPLAPIGKKSKILRKMRLKTLDFTQNRDIIDLYPVRVCAEVYENKI